MNGTPAATIRPDVKRAFAPDDTEEKSEGVGCTALHVDRHDAAITKTTGHHDLIGAVTSTDSPVSNTVVCLLSVATMPATS